MLGNMPETSFEELHTYVCGRRCKEFKPRALAGSFFRVFVFTCPSVNTQSVNVAGPHLLPDGRYGSSGACQEPVNSSARLTLSCTVPPKKLLRYCTSGMGHKTGVEDVPQVLCETSALCRNRELGPVPPPDNHRRLQPWPVGRRLRGLP